MSTSSFYTSSGTSQTLERSVADAADDAQKLATNPEDSQFTLSDGTTGFSALHHNAKAEDEKTAAQTAKTQAETARDTAQNHRDDAQKLSIQAEDSQFTLTDGVTTGYSALHYNAKAQAAKTDAESAASTTSGHVTTTTQNNTDSANARADALKIASNAHNSQYTLADTTTTGYSALHYATEAANSLSTFQGQYHGAAASDPTTGLDAGDLYFNTSGQLKVYSGTAWQNAAPSPSDQTNINTLAAISADVTSLANAIGVSTTYVVTVASGVFYIDGVANPTLTLDRGNTYIFDQSDSSNSGHPLAFKDGSGNSYTTGVTVSGTAGSAGATVTIDVASNAPSSLRYYCTVHGNGMGNTITTVNSNLAVVASNITSVNTVANSTNLANITAVAGDATDIGTVATDITGSNTIGTVAGNLTGTNTIGSVNGALTNINNVAGALTAINNVNSNLASVNNFGDTYFVGSSQPSSPTSGDLWFDTSTGVNKLKVYDGSAFNDAGSVVNGTSERSTYVVGTSSGGYTGSTTVFPATYDVGFVDLYLNGIKLTPSDFTATNGTSITLNSAAATNDTVDIVAYGIFNLTVAQANASNLTSGTIPDARFPAALPAVDGSNLTGINTDLVSDSSPQLGADLDANSNDILMGNQSVKFGTSKWEIVLDTADNDLNFKYNGTTVFKLSSAGAVVAADNITGYGTP